MQQHGNNRRRESWLLIGLTWLLKLGFLGRYQYIKEKKKKRVLGFKFLGFLGDGFGVKEKKRQTWADCVRLSQVPTSIYEILKFMFV
jgi:hypothetical protein